MERNYKICSRCIMDTTDPDIKFDAQGICNHCRNYDVRVAKEVYTGEEGKRKLDEVVRKISADGKGKKYDCIVGMSGGVDSTMVAYTAKKLGLRPLAVHFDNCWNSDLSIENIKRATEVLGIDLETYVVDWEEFKDLQLSFLKASVANCEIPTDHALGAFMYRKVAEHKIKYFISGWNVHTEGIMPTKSWGYYCTDLKYLKAIHSQFGVVPLRTFPTYSLLQLFWYVFVRKIRVIPILNYIDYNKTSAIELLQRELGWRYYGGKHYESIYTRFFQAYILPYKFGYDKRKAHLSSMICSGHIDREEALAEMKNDSYTGHNLEEDRAYVIKKLNISETEFDRLINMPVKSFKDYPHNKFIFDGFLDFREIFKKIYSKV